MAFQSRLGRYFFSIAAVLACLMASGRARAATITVNTTADTNTPGGGQCTLREAINNANSPGNDTTAGDCPVATGSDTIVFSVSGTITLTGAVTCVPTCASLPISNSAPGFLTIDGSGQNITIDGNQNEPLFVQHGATLNVKDLKFSNGSGQANGSEGAGAIGSHGALTINNSTFMNDFGPAGAIFSGGVSLAVSNSTFVSNPSWPIQTGGGATATITNCTFVDNASALLVGGPMSVTNSTIYGSLGSTPAIYVAGYIGGHLTIANSILSGNSAGNCQLAGGSLPPSSVITNVGYNIADDASCGFASSTGASGQTLGDNVSALLDPLGLQNNGGPTETIALQSTSPAIDAIPLVNCPEKDQRGVERGNGGETACDVGAFEYAPPGAPPTISISSPTSGTYLLNQAVPSAYNCSESVAGDLIMVCAGPVASGLDIDTASVGPKTFTVNATDSHNNSSSQGVNYTVAYNICPQYDQGHSVKSGATIPIKLDLCDINGADQSASGIVVHATGVAMVSTNASELLQDAGNANPDDDFRFDSTLGTTGGYIFNLSTSGYPSGTFALQFTAGSDPTPHVTQFQVK
jgi:CSLREA domain-containing protein